jgi:uncharacterized membrane protein YoaK (UPF0700 family)
VVVGIYRRFVKAPAQHGRPAGPAWRTKEGEVMVEATRAAERPISLPVSVLLSFVAGYVDSYTYLGFGLFVAQVTGSFVIAGAEYVTHEPGVVGKLVVVAAFLIAAALTAALIALLREGGRAALVPMLGLEAVLLAAFCAMIFYSPPVIGGTDRHGTIACVFAAMAMGAQSVLVRLLMTGVPQTNVMTGNMTQLGITTTELILAWRRRRDAAEASAQRQFAEVRTRLIVVLLIAVGFLAGVAAGAGIYSAIGFSGAVFAIVVVAALAVWALLLEGRG